MQCGVVQNSVVLRISEQYSVAKWRGLCISIVSCSNVCALKYNRSVVHGAAV